MEFSRRAVVGGLAVAVVPLPVAAAPPPDPLVLEAGDGKLRLLAASAAETAVWAYNSQVPGPLIRARKGEEVRVRLVNKLAQPTSLCWHGVRIANAMDGVAGLTQPPVAPGASFEYRFTPPDAGLYWYHPHVFPHSAEQIGRGLYGLLLVEEPGGPEVEQDLLLVIDDWSLDAKGAIDGGFLDRAVASGVGRIGATITLNAQPVPIAPMVVRPGARVRLRILNACSARIAIVTLAGMQALVVAIDGQASEVFPPSGDTLPIGSGSRFEVIADMPNEAGKAPALLLRGDGGPDRPLMTMMTKGEPIAARPRVGRLPMNPLLPTRIPLERSIKVNLALGDAAGTPASGKGAGKSAKLPHGKANPPASSGADWLWTIDGAGSDGLAQRPLFRVKRGGAVTIAFVNKTPVAQQMHVHGHVFRVLHDLDDGWDPYWRESILVGPGRTKHVAFIADNPGKWAIESLVLDRQVTGMTGWFEVG